MTRCGQGTQAAGTTKIKGPASGWDVLQPSCTMTCSWGQRHVLRRVEAKYKAVWVPFDTMELPHQPERGYVQPSCTQGDKKISVLSLRSSFTHQNLNVTETPTLGLRSSHCG